MQIEAVIWDLGGVLVRTMDRSHRVEWEQKLQLESGELDRLVFEGDEGQAAALGKAQAADIWQSLRNQFDLSAEDRRLIEKDFWAGDRVDQELIALILELRKHYKTGLLSNAWPDLRYALEDVWEIADAFDEILISSELGLVKPDPRIYELALERLAVAPRQAVFIDDFIVNIDAARAVGLHTIRFTSSAETQARLKSLLEV
jgi:putative hydrolase of the HAD superfamily